MADGVPQLDAHEQRQAAERAPIGPLVIHEIVREQGEAELVRPISGLAWSGLGAGLSIGFSALVQAYLMAGLPDEPWRRMVAGFGYSIGFLIVILGQQQLFTETTLTALIPTLTRGGLHNLLGTLRVWVVVLLANLIGTFLFAAVVARSGVFPPGAMAALGSMSGEMLGMRFWPMLVTAGFAGWLIGLMVWLLPGAGPWRPAVIILLTYVVALCGFPHVVAGSVEAAFGVFSGTASVAAYLGHFLLPTLLGNMVGGIALVAILNHAPVASDLKAE